MTAGCVQHCGWIPGSAAASGRILLRHKTLYIVLSRVAARETHLAFPLPRLRSRGFSRFNRSGIRVPGAARDRARAGSSRDLTRSTSARVTRYTVRERSVCVVYAAQFSLAPDSAAAPCFLLSRRCPPDSFGRTRARSVAHAHLDSVCSEIFLSLRCDASFRVFYLLFFCFKNRLRSHSEKTKPTFHLPRDRNICHGADLQRNCDVGSPRNAAVSDTA